MRKIDADGIMLKMIRDVCKHMEDTYNDMAPDYEKIRVCVSSRTGKTTITKPITDQIERGLTGESL